MPIDQQPLIKDNWLMTFGQWPWEAFTESWGTSAITSCKLVKDVTLIQRWPFPFHINGHIDVSLKPAFAVPQHLWYSWLLINTIDQWSLKRHVQMNKIKFWGFLYLDDWAVIQYMFLCLIWYNFWNVISKYKLYSAFFVGESRALKKIKKQRWDKGFYFKLDRGNQMCRCQGMRWRSPSY